MTAGQRTDASASAPTSATLRARRLGIDTQYEAVVFMPADCPICRSEGFAAQARVRLTCGERSTIATLCQVTAELLSHGEAGLSESAWRHLGLSGSVTISVSHPQALESLSNVRGKIYERPLDAAALKEVVTDIVADWYSDIHLSSFITACTARPLDHDETVAVALTQAMTDSGDRLSWATHPVVDKHCVGGLPGNRTTPIIVSIASACGLTMPKTSSRAITSPLRDLGRGRAPEPRGRHVDPRRAGARPG